MKRLLSLLLTALVATTALAQDATVIRLGETYPAEIGPDDVLAYRIDLASDMYVLGNVDQISVDAAVQVVGPNGQAVGTFDVTARGADWFEFTTRIAGTYRIEVRPFEQGAGRYTLALHRAEALPSSPEARMDQLLARFDSDRTPGAVVAVVRGGGLVYTRSVGMADVEQGVPNTLQTPFHTASVSKQFTAFAIAMLADRGRLSLDDDIRQHVPEVPDFGYTITLRHLITHTSGLRDQWSLWGMSGGRADDAIRQSDLLRLVERQRELNFVPGDEFGYCNTGYLLLSEVVARVTGQSFGAWMEANVFGPLGMENTQVYDDHMRIVPGRAYSYQGGPNGLVKSVLSYGNTGATSLFSTAADLALWVRNLGTAAVGGPDVARQVRERGVLANGDTLDYAFGLFIDEHRGLRRVQHSGADAGFRAWVMYYPDLDAGVIVLGNTATLDLGAVTLGAAEAFFGSEMEAEVESSPEAAVGGDEAEPLPLPSPRLDAYVGRYYSPELETVYTARLESGRLVMAHRRHGDATLQPTAPDAFDSDAWFLGSLAFERDASGTVTGMRATAGGVRNLFFETLE